MALRDYPNFLIENEEAAELTRDEVLKETNAAATRGFQRDGERGLLHDLYESQKKFHDLGKFSHTDLAETCVKLGKKHCCETSILLRPNRSKHLEGREN